MLQMRVAKQNSTGSQQIVSCNGTVRQIIRHVVDALRAATEHKITKVPKQLIYMCTAVIEEHCRHNYSIQQLLQPTS